MYKRQPSSRPPGRPSPGEVETGGYDSGRGKRKGPPRVEKRAAKRGEHSELQPLDDTILGILHIFIYHAQLAKVSFRRGNDITTEVSFYFPQKKCARYAKRI